MLPEAVKMTAEHQRYKGIRRRGGLRIRRWRVGVRVPARMGNICLALWLAGCAGAQHTPEGGAPAAVATTADAGPAAGRNHPRHLGKPYVVVVSFDGFRHDYMERFDTPNFDRMAVEGARADGLIPVFPSLTFPAHYSIATGLYPGTHGLVNNTFYDREFDSFYSLSDRETVEDGRWYGGEPIWVTAEKQGMVSAAFYFVGSEADVQGIRPSYWKRFDPIIPNEVRVDTVLTWLGLPDEERPHLVSLYFAEADYAGHRFGPGESPELAQAVAQVDRALGRLLDGLDDLPHGDRVFVILVSDHGMSDIRPEGHYALDEIADLSGARLTSGGTVGILFVEGGEERIEELRTQLGEGMPNAEVYRSHEAPARLHLNGHPRFGDLVVVPEEGYTIGIGPRRGSSRGMHGWDPSYSSMHGIFLVKGPGIEPASRLPGIESVDIYPFMARVLELEAAEGIEGDPGALAALARW
ncbi:MAG: alkaline phosphatase family protein [Gammaproteobacteria bacterium]|nr:alkaline phosphatase family protein [Gammaproteobacteria bacterium]